MRKTIGKFKKGAASFYIVAFSTLILVIIAASFAAIIISEVTRTSNDDLSQSAYDSALAGVEDAKLAFYSYQNCLQEGASDGSCAGLISTMENPDCDMVGKILGRIGDEGGEVVIQESNVGNNMQQAYTCVKIETSLNDYRSTLTSSNQTKVMRARFEDASTAAKIKKVRISWAADDDSTRYRYNNFDSTKDVVIFPKTITGGETAYTLATPPTISLAFVQTAASFTLDDLSVTVGGRTDRGMVYLVPTDDEAAAAKSADGNYIGSYTGGKNVVSASGVAKTNDKTSKNLPYAVYCPRDAGTEFVCTAEIELPEPVNGDRNADTFMFAVSIPYGKPSTDFALEFLCADGTVCSTETIDDGEETEEKTSNVAKLKGVQVEVDSTGRANDLFRRVTTRLEGADDFSLSMMGPLELLGCESCSETLLEKNYTVTCEWKSEFGGPSC